MHRFIRKITRKPVLLETGELRRDIIQVIEKLRARNKDPIKEFSKCKTYLEMAIGDMLHNKDIYCKWELYGNRKFTPGTRASLEYMLEGVNAILAKLSLEKIDSLFNPKTE